MKFAKLCERLAADQNRYKAMNDKKRNSFYGRFIYRRIRKTVEQIRTIERAIGICPPGGNYSPPQKPDR